MSEQGQPRRPAAPPGTQEAPGARGLPALADDTRAPGPRPRGAASGQADTTTRGALPSPARGPRPRPGPPRPPKVGPRGPRDPASPGWGRPHPALAPAAAPACTDQAPHSPGRRHERGEVSALPPPPLPPRCATRGGASRRPPAARRALREGGEGTEEGGPRSAGEGV